MTQTRLNCVMVLSTHTHLTDKPNLIDIANEFIRETEHRKTIFGTFCESDYC